MSTEWLGLEATLILKIHLLQISRFVFTLCFNKLYLEPGILWHTILYLFTYYSICKIVNKQRIVCDRIPGSMLFQISILVGMRGAPKMSRVVRKPDFCICENKDADQLRGNREADQRLCFRYTDSTIPLLPKSEISSL